VDLQKRPGRRMNSAYNVRVPGDGDGRGLLHREAGGKPAAGHPRDQPEVGSWSRIKLEIEWGFQSGKSLKHLTARRAFIRDGRRGFSAAGDKWTP